MDYLQSHPKRAAMPFFVDTYGRVFSWFTHEREVACGFTLNKGCPPTTGTPIWACGFLRHPFCAICRCFFLVGRHKGKNTFVGPLVKETRFHRDPISPGFRLHSGGDQGILQPLEEHLGLEVRANKTRLVAGPLEVSRTFLSSEETVPF